MLRVEVHGDDQCGPARSSYFETAGGTVAADDTD